MDAVPFCLLYPSEHVNSLRYKDQLYIERKEEPVVYCWESAALITVDIVVLGHPVWTQS